MGCEIINLGESTAIICGGKPKDHECNEDAHQYTTFNGEFYYFKDRKEADEWYEHNYKGVQSSSVACSICQHAAIDDAYWL